MSAGDALNQVKLEPQNLEELQESYDRLYHGWLGSHQNIEQAKKMLDMLDIQQGRKFIDIGCGMGYVLEMATKKGLWATGIDLSMVALAKAKDLSQNQAKVVLCAAEQSPFPAASFDYVFNLGSLEHFLNPGQAVSEARRLISPSGQAVFLVPNSHHIRAIYNVLKFGEILTDEQDFERFATRKEWERLFEANGFKILKVDGFDTGFARIHRTGREGFWYVYNILFKLFGRRWIPLNLSYTFIFLLEPI